MRRSSALGLRIADDDEEIVIGFRRDGYASFFLSPQRVYQFNTQGQLRRAYVGELMYKAERGRSGVDVEAAYRRRG